MFNPTSTFTGYSTNDVTAARAFYVDTLGLQAEEFMGGLHLKLPGNTEAFIYPKPDHQPASYTTMNFIVADIDEAVDALEQKGVVFEQYNSDDIPQDEKGICRGLSADMGPDIAWFKDPAGNILAVVQNQ
jgi:catechol 2,3-dioxygenase-like lactoylglutathione lyase family enzyme